MHIRLKRFLRLLFFTLTVVFLALFGVIVLGFPYVYIDSLVHRPCGDNPTPLTEQFHAPESLEAFTFSPANDSAVVLDGWYAAGTNGAGVILLGGAWGGHNNQSLEMNLFHQAGYSVLTYDTRSCANPPQTTSLGYTEIADLQAAIDLMLAYPEMESGQLGVFGHSMGGATAIMTAAQDERIQVVAASGNYADLAYDVRRGNPSNPLERVMRGSIEWFYERETGVNIDLVRPIAVIGQISPRPILLIHGSLELHETRGAEQFAAAGEPKELWIVEGAGHGGYPAVAPADYETRLLTFFETYLKP